MCLFFNCVVASIQMMLIYNVVNMINQSSALESRSYGENGTGQLNLKLTAGLLPLFVGTGFPVSCASEPTCTV